MPIATPRSTLKVYLLCQGPDRPMSFAPHGWKTILPLRLLDVPHEKVYVTLAELRTVLPKVFHLDKVTLPALVIEGDDKHRIILDSYIIAQYLEVEYGSPSRSIFQGSAGRRFSRFIEQWVDRSLAAGIRPCVLHTSYDQFPTHGRHADTASRTAFLAKCGQAKMDELIALNGNAEWRTKQYATIRHELGTIETLLQESDDDGDTGSFLGGTAPIHADFCVFAFYAYSRTNKDLVEETWHHPSLPCVQRWLGSMLRSGLVQDSDLLPL